MLPARSPALTWKVCEPSLRPVYCVGELHGCQPDPSRLHPKALGSLLVNAKCAEAPPRTDAARGDVIVTSGRVVSTVQRYVEGAPMLPARSIALTWKVWE